MAKANNMARLMNTCFSILAAGFEEENLIEKSIGNYWSLAVINITTITPIVFPREIIFS